MTAGAPSHMSLLLPKDLLEHRLVARRSRQAGVAPGGAVLPGGGPVRPPHRAQQHGGFGAPAGGRPPLVPGRPVAYHQSNRVAGAQLPAPPHRGGKLPHRTDLLISG